MIDEDAAEVVKYIFKLCSEGRGPSQIARQLTDEQIANPSNHYFKLTGATLTNLNTERPFHWDKGTVLRMLDDETYFGHTVYQREKYCQNNKRNQSSAKRN